MHINVWPGKDLLRLFLWGIIDGLVLGAKLRPKAANFVKSIQRTFTVLVFIDRSS